MGSIEGCSRHQDSGFSCQRGSWGGGGNSIEGVVANP